jgi:nucleoside transporter
MSAMDTDDAPETGSMTSATMPWYRCVFCGLQPWTWWRLGIMMFLQYAIWGAWSTVLSMHLEKLGLTGVQTGAIFSLLYLSCIITPFIGGQFADRWVPVQYVIAVLHLISGAAMWFAAGAKDMSSLWPLMLVAGLAYAPTLALTNSLAFKHMTNAERQFGSVRVFGTIGWIVAGLLLTAWRSGRLAEIGIGSWPNQGDCLILAAVFSGVLAVFALALPHTPPAKEAANPWAFLGALKMLRSPSFLVFMVIAFVVTTELQFYYILTAPFLESIGIKTASVSGWMTLAQWAEILVMAVALPIVLPRWGVGKTLAVGVIAWPIRYVIFAIGHPTWLVLASLTLHGLCYVFFFTVSMVYVDSVASDEIRHSAQSLITLVTLGLGNYAGTFFTGWVKDHFTQHAGATAVANWHMIFFVPIVLTVLCALAFFAFFRAPAKGEKIA